MPSRSSVSEIAIILSRIEYGERDRIITVLTARRGKIKAIAKGVRAAKSKLAGGIELFAENQLMLLPGKGDLYTLTSSRMVKYFGNIASDIDRAMFGYECLKNINKLTVDDEGSEHYSYLLEVLQVLNQPDLPLVQIKIWFNLKLLGLIGVSPNLKTLSSGQPLPDVQNFSFDADHQCFFVHQSGSYNQNHIKILRYFDSKNAFAPINNCPDETLNHAQQIISSLLSEHLS